jgi:hypothetical protein
VDRLEADLEVVSRSKSSCELWLADAAFGLGDSMLLAEELGSAPGWWCRLGALFLPLLVGLLEVGAAEMAFVLVEPMLFAVQATLLLELWLAKPAAVFVATVLLAPQSSRFSLGWVADEARLTRSVVAVSYGGGVRTWVGRARLRSRVAATCEQEEREH